MSTRRAEAFNSTVPGCPHRGSHRYNQTARHRCSLPAYPSDCQRFWRGFRIISTLVVGSQTLKRCQHHGYRFQRVTPRTPSLLTLMTSKSHQWQVYRIFPRGWAASSGRCLHRLSGIFSSTICAARPSMQITATPEKRVLRPTFYVTVNHQAAQS